MKKLFSISLLATFLMAGSSVLAQSSATTLPDTLASKIQGNYFVHEGYRFDISQVLNDEHLEDLLRQLEWQVYFVTVLNLPQEIQDFFKSVSVVVVAPTTLSQENNYDFTTPKGITLCADSLEKDQSYWKSYKIESCSLLIFLLAALLDQHLPQGTNNPDVLTYFQQAKSLPCYRGKNSSWISGDFSETDAVYSFFTDAAVAYLRGSSWEEPFSCYEIQKNQPEFFQYLENLFGAKSGFINQSFSYHGFHFNWSQMDDFSHYQEIWNTCIRQVDYIESTGVLPKVMDFFKSVPVTLKPSYEMMNGLGEFGVYDRFYKSVSLNANDAALSFLYAGKPDVTLLHELLHAFQDQVLLDGDNNPYIPNFYQDAMEHRYYYDPKNNLNYWMTNEYEFFACTATAFLDNYTPDEPFNRRNICKYQPDYYLYLQGIFGTNHDDMGIIERNLISNATDHLY